MKKRILSTFMILILALSMCACGSDSSDVENLTEDLLNAAQEASQVTEETAEGQESPSIENTETQEEMPTENPETEVASAQTENTFPEAMVKEVIDGDTIVVSIGNEDRKVRLIGVDTPETKHPDKPVQFLGPEASDFTTKSLSNKTVYLERDVSETDKYGRLLFYVWLTRPKTNDPTKEEVVSNMFNAKLLLSGFAKPVTYPPDVKYQSIFSEISRNAQEQSLGIWSAQADPVVPAPPKPEDRPKTSIADLPEIPITTEEAYVGNSNTMKFHHKNCKSAKKISPEHRVPFATSQDARNAGYVPCKQCKP